MIKHDYDAVASYAERVAGHAATSPSVTGAKLTTKRLKKPDYLRYVKEGARITRQAQSAVPAAKVTASYRRGLRRRGRHRARPTRSARS